MQLRKLLRKDAEFMLEWMHDGDVVHWLNADFGTKTIKDCIEFIEESNADNKNLHLAIVDDLDNYMGTVSLKHICLRNKNAEFAITVRKCAMGKGYADFGMKEILTYGMDKLGLEHIYWCVSTANVRAVRFYDKNHYIRIDNVPEEIREHYDIKLQKNLIWYAVD